jgi:hypothetical protein
MGACLNSFIGFIVLLGIILAIALPLASIKSLEPSELGLAYSAWSKKLDES